jgi:hypothetical protein
MSRRRRRFRLLGAVLVVVLAVFSAIAERAVRRVAKTRAQTAADAGALAGAGSFLESPADQEKARSRAIEYVMANSTPRFPLSVSPEDVRVDMENGTIQLDVKVRAYTLPKVVAWIVGGREMQESARAAAEAQVPRCVPMSSGGEYPPLMRCEGMVKKLRLIR